MDSKIIKKITHSITDENNKQHETSGVLFTESSDKLTNFIFKKFSKQCFLRSLHDFGRHRHRPAQG